MPHEYLDPIRLDLRAKLNDPEAIGTFTVIDTANGGYMQEFVVKMYAAANRQIIGVVRYDEEHLYLLDKPEPPRSSRTAPGGHAAQPTATTQEKIQKQIEALQRKIKAVSGDYKTNTYKRMREQESRDAKAQSYIFDVQILVYLYGLCEQRNLTMLEAALIVGAFRDEFHGYYSRHKAWTETPPEKRYSAWVPVTFPEITSNTGEWYNKEVPIKQRRLYSAGIRNTPEFHAAIAEYAELLESATKTIDYTAQEIKRLTNEARMQQKGDIQFTPGPVARRLVELAGIDGNSIVLEPSAGIGGIADIIREITPNVEVIERMASFRELLELKGYAPVAWDFLGYQPEKRYTAIIMNPPFSGNQDIEHVTHAYSLLADGGVLVAVVSPHWTFANDKKSVQFREWLDHEVGYDSEDLNSGTFEMTGVQSKIIVIRRETEQETSV